MVIMVLKTKSKLRPHQRSNTMYLTIPSSMTRDSQFPFNTEGEEVIITIQKDQIIITKKGGE